MLLRVSPGEEGIEGGEEAQGEREAALQGEEEARAISESTTVTRRLKTGRPEL